ncbi:hypothetical protein DCS_03319 [Drechmeria coniospora]|uniref:HET-s/LopB domain protein n=1 Tax=Drechmeria coniospora TaxID=98403 RepID=A0A151GH14_DRECN|nr:hypothetical protein DCS_03319 [Drechmeria coniospora]KYK56321.1 hypothetical protein DCS_03319 [Drechmeria coniospora]
MASFAPLAGFQLPLRPRLSALYDVTKKSADFVGIPLLGQDHNPDVKDLQRKLRIQRDRFSSWGLEWSDSNQASEMEESLSRAGLSEVVGSILSTIKDIHAEVEPMWLRLKAASEGSPREKSSLVSWDKARFEDLVRDLTSCIDTLFDLSRARSGVVPRRTCKTAYVTPEHELRPFESTRMQAPQQIDPKTLTHLPPAMEGTPPAMERTVAFMSRTAYAELNPEATNGPIAPLLLEYAAFDPIFATTGIMPPMALFEKLFAGLLQDSQRPPAAWTGLPRLLGYFEDLENARLGLVYRFPTSFDPVSVDEATQKPAFNLPTLRQLLSAGGPEPPLEAKFRLAHNLANTVFDMHARCITHGNLTDASICFAKATRGFASSPRAVDIRRPLVSSFDLFTPPVVPLDLSSWHHPLDPQEAKPFPVPALTDRRVLELHALAVLLLSIGLWTKHDVIAAQMASAPPSESLLDELAVRCGSLYRKAVEVCWRGADEEASGNITGVSLLSSVQDRVTRYLETCCILDGVIGQEERLAPKLQPHDSQQLGSKVPEGGLSDAKTSTPERDASDAKASTPESRRKKEATREAEAMGKAAAAVGTIDPLAPVVCTMRANALADTTTAAVPKMRLYPHVPLAPDDVEKWNKILMPQINQALRHFYRKHAESVEISLESVGTSPSRTRPTVLVVCASVGKVRAILKKQLGCLFDGTTGFALKVCRGCVVRSRKQSATATADAEGDDNAVEAANTDRQRRVHNGASIGAWTGKRHLPPVSYGGLILVDGVQFGMTVHHMLDDPELDDDEQQAIRSMKADAHAQGKGAEDDEYCLSDTESEASFAESDDVASDDGDEDDARYFAAGDIPGLDPGLLDEPYVVTQPALDDVRENFYPVEEDKDDEHLCSMGLGEVYASSGIRRRLAHGLVHEVDWALFEFTDSRPPGDNEMPRACGSGDGRLKPADGKADAPVLRPTSVVPSSSLPGMAVQCMARTSGLRTGQILPALTSVKIYGRQTPSHTYQVTSQASGTERSDGEGGAPIGTPGDSGAWIVNRHDGRLCGHVLAWSQRKRVAYICPMDVLLLDVAETVKAKEIRLPGGAPVPCCGDEPVGRTAAADDEAAPSTNVDEAAWYGEVSPFVFGRLEDSSFGRSCRIGLH